MKFLLFFSTCLICVYAYPYLDQAWWKNCVIYEVLVHAYKDSDGDGVGDIRGLISKLDYLSELGIDALYLTPFNIGQFKDMGYDITDYYEIDPRYGTMRDFQELLQEMKVRNMKLIMDLVINHSSKQHEWFQKSRQRIDPYTDYYIWENAVNYGDDSERHPPNSWRSVFEDSAWAWDDTRKQYYYHMFLTDQPDLNLRNANVRQEMKNMISFWFDKGVAGFRMDAPMNYIEDKYLREDEDRQSNQKESFEWMHELAKHVENYNSEHSEFQRILAPEAHAPPDLVTKYFGKEGYPMTDFAFNYHLEYVGHELDAFQLQKIILASLTALPAEGRFAWVSQDHDGTRTGSRIGPQYADILTIITALLPGIFHVYYGQEIGLLNGMVREEQRKDFSANGKRDPNRLIMQWDSSLNAGFTTNKIPFSPSCVDYTWRNVESEKLREKSHYYLLKNLITLRRSEVVRNGDFHSYIYSEDVFIFWRSSKNHAEYLGVLGVINLGHDFTKVNLKKLPLSIYEDLTVHAMSINSKYERGDVIGYERNHRLEVTMEPQAAVVLSTEKINLRNQWRKKKNN